MKTPLLKTYGAWAIALGALVTTTSLGASAGAATGGGGCQLDGTATFAPNGPGTADTFGYSFGGALSGCQSSVAGAPTSGTIAAGQALTESVPLTVTNPDGTTTTTQGTARYQEPAATGTSNVPGASCVSGATSGTAVTSWSDGSTDVISYTTQSVAAGVELDGTVVPSVTLALVPGSQSVAGSAAPSSYTIATTSSVFPVGNGAQGLLTFQVADPTQCTTASGVTDAAISGIVGVGSTS
jgi:hypothetical protein